MSFRANGNFERLTSHQIIRVGNSVGSVECCHRHLALTIGYVADPKYQRQLYHTVQARCPQRFGTLESNEVDPLARTKELTLDNVHHSTHPRTLTVRSMYAPCNNKGSMQISFVIWLESQLPIVDFRY